MTSYRLAATALLALAAMLASSPSLRAQSTTAGAVAGSVRGLDGLALGNVQLHLQPVGGGFARTAETRGGGLFSFPLVEPGEYELLAERLGYRPVLLGPIPVRAERRVDVRVTLEEAAGPVTAPDRVVFEGRALAGGSSPGRSRYVGEWELEGLPQRQGSLAEMLRLASSGEPPLEVEGLPTGFGGVSAEGMPFRPAAVSGAGDDPMATLLFPSRSSAGAELLAGRPDVEWPGVAGGLLATTLPRGAQGGVGELGGSWSGEALASDAEIPAGFADWRAGGSAGTSLVQDSAHLWVFGEAQHHERPVRYWTGRAGSAEAFAAAGVDVTALEGQQAGAEDRVNLGGAFDWRFGPGRRIDVVALYGQGERDHALAGFSGVDVPVTAEGRDLFAGATATAALSEQVGLQLRVGYGQSSREHTPRPVIESPLGDATLAFAPGAVQLGGDPAFPATVDRSALTGQGTLHLWNADHHVKLGAGVQLASHERTEAWGGDGLYLFGSPAELADRVGVFRGAGGTLATASFSVPELHAFGQDTWRIVPGFDLTTGVRYEVELLPADDVAANTRWQELTGIDNTAIPESVSSLSLVAGFDWDVRERHLWRVRGAVAMQVGDVDPALLAEAITHDGRITASAAVGDVTEPTTLGPRLAILSPDFEPPVTTRGSFGISRALGSTAALHLDGVLRETINLPTRTDLNLPATAPYRDQYDRPVFGPLARVGPLLAAEPGANRRFGELDAVSALASSASSTYWGVTAALEKRFGFLKALGSYTYSSTEDDWLAAAAGSPLDALAPFPGDDDWADGVSDFDVPHRATLAAELTLPFAPMVSVGGFWRMESGRPFTPGFGRAIDANADGVAGNDPAFIDASIPGFDEVATGWDCLRTSAGRFAERNSCRTDPRTLLDAWLGIRIPGLGAVTPELRVEALALDGEGYDTYDTALYRLDPEGALVTDPETGTITVPLVVNPNFGEQLVPVRELSRVRISLRMTF